MSETNEEILKRWKGYIERDLADAIAERAQIDRRIERLKDGLETFAKLLPDIPTPSPQ